MIKRKLRYISSWGTTSFREYEFIDDSHMLDFIKSYNMNNQKAMIDRIYIPTFPRDKYETDDTQDNWTNPVKFDTFDIHYLDPLGDWQKTSIPYCPITWDWSKFNEIVTPLVGGKFDRAERKVHK